MDGDLSNVNPGILALSKDPDLWREQRRKAMREKIFGSGGREEVNSTSNKTSNIGKPSPSDVAANEAFILKQILSHKRSRDESTGQQPLLSTPASTPPCEAPKLSGRSLKERLLEKYDS